MRWQKCGRSCQGHGLQIFDGNVTHLDIDRFSRNLGKLSFYYMSTTTENVSSIGKKSGEKIHPTLGIDTPKTNIHQLLSLFTL